MRHGTSVVRLIREQDRVGRFFLKRRNGFFHVCWFDAAARQTRCISTRSNHRETAQRILAEHAVRATRVSGRPTILDGCEVLQPATQDGELLDADRLIAMAVGHSASAGVYFLICGASIIYVGQSLRPRSRVQQHARDGVIEFDRYLIIPCQRDALREIERRYIEKLSPSCNRTTVRERSARTCSIVRAKKQ